MLRALLAPRMLALHVLALVAVTAATLLGFWQLDAWEQRRDLAARDLADSRPQPLSSVMSPDDPFPGEAVGQRVDVTGRWVGDDTFYVADRGLGGRTGYWEVTPLAVCPEGAGPTGGYDGCARDGSALLVVRGWTAEPDRDAAAPSGLGEVRGWLQPPEGTGDRDPDPSDDVLQDVRIADALQQVDQDLYGAYLIAQRVRPLGESTTADLARLEPVTPASLPQPETFTAWRNFLYALEWWVFAAFAAYVWWRWCADEVARSTRRPAGSGPPPADEPSGLSADEPGGLSGDEASGPSGDEAKATPEPEKATGSLR